MAVLRNLFTEADNATWDIGRFQWAAGTVVFFALSLYAYIYRNQPFDPVTWGAGFGAVMAAGGAMIWMKGKEPDDPPRHTSAGYGRVEAPKANANGDFT